MIWPETGNHASTAAPFGMEDGYIFAAVLKAGGTVRNYGFLVKADCDLALGRMVEAVANGR